MGTARYYPQGFGPAPMAPASTRRLAYIVTGVTVLSAVTVFLSLCARDNSRLLLASSPEQEIRVQPAPERREIVSADTQPAADSITRVTVPEATATPAPAVAAQQAETEAAPRSQPEPAFASGHTGRYVEFALARSKRFQQVGPVSVGVWRIDNKHKLCDISLLADGRRINRKHVGLNSPVLVSYSKSGRPLQVVVNSMDRGGIAGYVSEPAVAK